MASKVRLWQLGQDVIDFILQNGDGTGPGGSTLTWDVISNVSVGAVSAGTVFKKGEDVSSILTRLLVQDITPSCSTIFTNAGVREKGDSVDGTDITLIISNLEEVNVPIEKVNFYAGDTLIESQPFKENKDTYIYHYKKPITEDKTFKAEVEYNGGKTIFGIGVFSFVSPSYYGITDMDYMSSTKVEDLIPALTKIISSNNYLDWGGINLNDERCCYLYPTTLELLSSIIDNNDNQLLEDYSCVPVNIITPDGEKTPYYCYLMKESLTKQGYRQIFS